MCFCISPNILFIGCLIHDFISSVTYKKKSWEKKVITVHNNFFSSRCFSNAWFVCWRKEARRVFGSTDFFCYILFLPFSKKKKIVGIQDIRSR